MSLRIVATGGTFDKHYDAIKGVLGFDKTHLPQVLAQAETYLRWAGPGFAFYGLGITLYFASQGAGQVLQLLSRAAMRATRAKIMPSWRESPPSCSTKCMSEPSTATWR